MLLWIYLLKNPESYNQFDSRNTVDRLYTSANLIVFNNMRESILEFEFFDLRPVTVSPLPFRYGDEGQEVPLTVTWAYTYYMPRDIGGEEISLTLEE